jgi:hypothetical protein
MRHFQTFYVTSKRPTVFCHYHSYSHEFNRRAVRKAANGADRNESFNGTHMSRLLIPKR